ncbi:parkinson disease 7 domain-containing protein 1, variant [Capsaspora owczarzaki ATCC 30864]|uniref:Glutamine amidotransferase-like class 1 domain-containing protein 1 n=1 Tax=Capsaspora owczarzaki (strain ATCC 30864) TaxID=595528 RepID=A0A0D2UKU2_CAPO3|nr:parkinson disease 7 domain-containing protein 1, variant [Capsaspora owczarzaki ATCC 30864]
MASPATSLSPPTQPSTPSSQPQAQQQQRALLLTTASALGISAHSFIHSYTLASSLFAVTIATPGGGPLHFPETDANSRRWLDDFLAKPAAVPVAVESLDLTLFAALLIPGGAGTITDLPHNAAVAHLAMAFDRDKKLICAVGLGVSVLCASALLGNKGADWQFAGRCMTAVSQTKRWCNFVRRRPVSILRLVVVVRRI